MHGQPLAYRFFVVVALSATLLLPPLHCDAQDESDENDPTKQLLQQLNLSLVEVIDENTVSMRHASRKDGKGEVLVRLGNTGSPLQGSLDDKEYAAKRDASKAALVKLCDKMAVWYKFAPESVQPPILDGSKEVKIADLWTKGGKHINSALKKDGHLTHAEEYESDIAKDIFAAAAAEAKEESYKKLAEAMKESEAAKRAAKLEAMKEARAKEEEEPESFGLVGWLAIAGLVALAIGVATNFGKSKKNKSLNRKSGIFEKFRSRWKGA
jgi:endonuclease YncB( thermonuclease family)